MFFLLLFLVLLVSVTGWVYCVRIDFTYLNRADIIEAVVNGLLLGLIIDLGLIIAILLLICCGGA